MLSFTVVPPVNNTDNKDRYSIIRQRDHSVTSGCRPLNLLPELRADALGTDATDHAALFGVAQQGGESVNPDLTLDPFDDFVIGHSGSLPKTKAPSPVVERGQGIAESETLTA
jgi:hypothetical protein